MFSFLKFLNSKSDDKSKLPNALSGKTLNLNSPEARALNIFNNKSPIARKSNGNNTFSRSDCKDTVTSPGFSFRIAQKVNEMKSTTSNIDESNLSTSYILENSLNGGNMINTSNKTRDVYDKKRKLMETLDNFGVRKRTRQEASVDSFVNRRHRTISESNVPDRLTVLNGHNQRLTQPNSKCVIIENKKTKRHGDFETNMCLSQKKPKTRNNEILSSYSSSKFLLTPGQKRSYENDYEDESPKRKHCKSCTCCGSTLLLESDQTNPDKRDKTTETDLPDDLVTVAASRIFNRSGKTQIVKKMSIKTILDEEFDDIDPIPYTSIEKLQEKKKKAQEKVISNKEHSDISTPQYSSKSIDSVPPVTVTLTSNFNGIQPVITSISSTSSSTVSVSSATLNTTPSVQLTIPPTLGSQQSESTPNVNEEKNSVSPQFSFNDSITSPTSLDKVNPRQSNEVDKNTINNQIPESNNIITSTIQVSNKDQHNADKDNRSIQVNESASKPSEPVIKSSSINDSSKTIENDIPNIQFTSPNSKKEAAPSITFGSQVETPSKQPLFTFGVPKTDEKSTPVMQFGIPKVDDKQSAPVMQFGSPKVDDKLSTPTIQFGIPKTDEKKSTPIMQFGAPKEDNKQSTPIMQFGAPKEDNKQSTPIMQFGAPKVDDKQFTPVMQFGTSKVDDKQFTPVMQFGAPNANDKISTPVMQFGAPKVDEKQVTPVLQFGASKTDNQQSTPTLKFGTSEASINSTCSPAFSFNSSNQKSNETAKPTESVKFQFGSSKPDNPSLAEPKNNVVFGSNNLQSQNLFKFGKTENNSLVSNNPPNYDASTEKSTPKLQFGTLPTPVFGTSNADPSKSQFSSSANQLIENQGSKVVFGNQIAENKAPTSASTMAFPNNTTNSIFQFNSSNSKLNDKPPEVSSGSFQFSSAKTVSNFGDKPAFQFNVQQTKDPKAQFSSSSFGSQSTSTAAPFKFGSNDKPALFGNTGNTFTSNQPLQFSNNNEKTAEPFKFGSTVASTNAFQFSTSKTDNGPVKFGQTSNTFPTPGFSGFGNSTSQQTTFGGVSPPQSSPFGNMTSPTVASPTFGSVASPPSNTFGTNQSFQFGNSNNNPSSSSTFAFSGNVQPNKPEGPFNFNASSSTTTSPFQFGQASTPQFGGTQTQGPFGFTSPPMTATVMPGSSQPLFSMGAPPAGERRKAKAVRRRQ